MCVCVCVCVCKLVSSKLACGENVQTKNIYSVTIPIMLFLAPTFKQKEIVDIVNVISE